MKNEKKLKDTILKACSILESYIIPDSTLTADDVIDKLLPVLDNEELVRAMGNTSGSVKIPKGTIVKPYGVEANQFMNEIKEIHDGISELERFVEQLEERKKMEELKLTKKEQLAAEIKEIHDGISEYAGSLTYMQMPDGVDIALVQSFTATQIPRIAKLYEEYDFNNK